MKTHDNDSVRTSRSAPTALAAATLAIALSGCAFMDASRVEEDFGNSVRQMVQAQIYDPQAASAPAENAPDALDGEAATGAVEGYREAARTAREEEQAPSFSVTFD